MMATLQAQALAGAKMKCIGTKFIECLFFCVYILVHSMKNKSQLIFVQRQTNSHADILTWALQQISSVKFCTLKHFPHMSVIKSPPPTYKQFTLAKEMCTTILRRITRDKYDLKVGPNK